MRGSTMTTLAVSALVVDPLIVRRCLYCGSAVAAADQARTVVCPGCMRIINVRHYQFSRNGRDQLIETSGHIEIPEGVEVQGHLRAYQIRIAGNFLGQLAAYECILEPTARVVGQVICRHLQLEPGALLEAELILQTELDPE